MEQRVILGMLDTLRAQGRRVYLDKEVSPEVMLELVKVFEQAGAKWAAHKRAFTWPLEHQAASELDKMVRKARRRMLSGRRYGFGGHWFKRAERMLIDRLIQESPCMNYCKVLIAQCWTMDLALDIQEAWPAAEVWALLGQQEVLATGMGQMNLASLSGGWLDVPFLDLTFEHCWELVGGFDVIIVVPPMTTGYAWARWAAHALDLVREGGVVLAFTPGNIYWTNAPVAQPLLDIICTWRDLRPLYVKDVRGEIILAKMEV